MIQQNLTYKRGTIASIAASFLLLISGALTPDRNHEIMKAFWELSEHARGELNPRKGFRCDRCPQVKAICPEGQCQ